MFKQQIQFRHLDFTQQKKYEQRLFHDDVRIRLIWINNLGIIPSSTQYSRGLEDPVVLVRIAWIKRGDLTPTYQQYSDGLKDVNPAIRLAWTNREDLHPNMMQYKSGIADSNESVRFAWANRRNLAIESDPENFNSNNNSSGYSFVEVADLNNTLKKIKPFYLNVVINYIVAYPVDINDHNGIIVDYLYIGSIRASCLTDDGIVISGELGNALIVLNKIDKEKFSSNQKTIQIMENIAGRDKYWRVPFRCESLRT